MTSTTNNEQTFFDDWFGSQEARDKILPIADKGDAASTDDLIEMMKIAFLAGAEAQKAVTMAEILEIMLTAGMTGVGFDSGMEII